MNKPVITEEPYTNKREPIETSLKKLDLPVTYKLDCMETSLRILTLPEMNALPDTSKVAFANKLDLPNPV